MKKILVLAFVLAMSVAGFGQSYVTSVGGALTSGFSDKSLMLTTSPVVYYNNGTGGPAMGYVSIQTPVLASGTLAGSGAFGAGGAFVVQIASVPLTFNGTFQSGAWTKITAANGTHYYQMTGTLTDVVTGKAATFELLTANIGSGNFDTVASVASVSITLD